MENLEQLQEERRLCYVGALGLWKNFILPIQNQEDYMAPIHLTHLQDL